MPTVRLSGKVIGPDDARRPIRAKLLFLLFNEGWDIYNSNGDQTVTLANIEKKLIESDAFVFTPGASLNDMFQAVSIFVGYQTVDPNLKGKPTVILNDDRSWDPLFRVLAHLREMGTIKQDYREFLLTGDSPEEVVTSLAAVRSEGLPDAGREKIASKPITAADVDPPEDLRGNVCVFCSASLEDPAYVADGEALGRLLADNKMGCVSGAGSSGIMGAVVRGSVEAGGWTAGSNVPHIIELEGLPDGLSRLWLQPDIYTRMEVMIENSDAFVIFPGGSGSVQELFALMILRHQKNPIMEGKPIIVFNRPDANGVSFWSPLIELLSHYCEENEFDIATSLDEIKSLLLDKVGA